MYALIYRDQTSQQIQSKIQKIAIKEHNQNIALAFERSL